MTPTRILSPTLRRLHHDQRRQEARHARRLGAPLKTGRRRTPPGLSAVFAIALVFALGAAAALPVPVAAQTAATLSGQVVDPDGIPLANVDVTATKHSGVGDVAQVQDTTTDANGSYAFDSLSAGTWNLTFRGDGYGKVSKEQELNAGDDRTLNVTLTPSWAKRSDVTLTVQVLDDASGDPIEGAELTLTGYFREGPTKRTTTTDAEGRASIDLYEGENQVHIVRKGYRAHDFWTTPEHEQEIDRAPIRLVSVPAQSVTITGTVTDAATGDPVQAYIQLRPDWERMEADKREGSGGSGAAEPERAMVYDPHHGSNNWNSTTTDTDGTFTMHAYPGHVVLSANRVDFVIAETKMTLSDGETKQADLTLNKMPEKSVTLSGTVRDAKSGDPIRGAAVNVQVPAWADHAWVRTDNEGQYSVKVRPGYTVVEVAHHGYWYGDDVVVMETREGSDGEATASSDGARDSDGEAEAEPEPDAASSTLVAPPREGPQYYTKSEAFTTSAGENRTLDVALPPKPEPQTELVGYVVDAENQTGVAGAEVNYHNQETGDWGHATTDADGSYRFMVRGGYSTLRVWVDGYLPTVLDVSFPDDGRVRQDLHVQPGTYAQAGWWDPDGHDRDCCYAYEEASADGSPMMAKSGGSGASDDAARSQFESSAAAGGSPDGVRVEGEGGGLGPYDPATAPEDGRSDDDATRDAPAPGLMLAGLAIGLAALVVGLRGRDD